MIDSNFVVREVLCGTRGECSIGVIEFYGRFLLGLISPCCGEVAITPTLLLSRYSVRCNSCESEVVVPLRSTTTFPNPKDFVCYIHIVEDDRKLGSWVSCLIHESAEVDVDYA